MRLSLFLLSSFVLLCQPIIPQSKAKISDVDFSLVNDQIVINYNITGSLPKEVMTISLKFITETNQEIIPKTTMGDIGPNIRGDGAKIIIWDIMKDQLEISGVLKANVTIDYSKILYSGPSNALLSILIPGLGGYFVDEHKVRAVFTTISTVGLMAYGLTQKKQADKYYKDYNESTVPSEIQDMYDKANTAQHNYYISTRAGAAIWILDVVWVTFKGIHNKKAAKSFSAYSNDGIKLYYVNNGLQLGYSVSF
jgi:hypothetical protein